MGGMRAQEPPRAAPRCHGAGVVTEFTELLVLNCLLQSSRHVNQAACPLAFQMLFLNVLTHFHLSFFLIWLHFRTGLNFITTFPKPSHLSERAPSTLAAHQTESLPRGSTSPPQVLHWNTFCTVSLGHQCKSLT